MSWATRQILQGLIEGFNLHGGGVPVDLTPLEERFPLFLEDMEGWGSSAYCVPERGRRPARVVVAKHEPVWRRRLLYAHEIGHVALGHEGSFRAMDVSEWFHDRNEHHAWRFASGLLVPVPIIRMRASWSIDEMAAACEVPTGLLELHPELHG